MSILSFIQQHFGFREVKWEASERYFQTDRGLKKVLIWDDPDLAQWHCQWRDHLAAYDDVFIDRMLMAKNGERIIRYGHQWITCHDASREAYPFKNNEDFWGNFIGFLLSQSTHYQYHNQRRPLKKEPEPFDKGLISLRKIKKERWDTSLDILVKCLPLAKKRAEQSSKLSEKTIGHGIPYTPPLIDPSEGKQFYGLLFWEAGQAPPKVGYDYFITFLSRWLSETSLDRFHKLLNAIDTYYPLRGEHGERMMADLLYPNEWIACLQALQFEENADRMGEIVDRFKKEWDEKSKCLGAIHDFLKHDQGEVAN